MAPCGAEDGCKPPYLPRACRCPERFLQPGRLLLGVPLAPPRFLPRPVLPTACPSTLLLHNVFHPTLFLCKTAPCSYFSCLTQIQPLSLYDHGIVWVGRELQKPPSPALNRDSLNLLRALSILSLTSFFSGMRHPLPLWTACARVLSPSL